MLQIVALQRSSILEPLYACYPSQKFKVEPEKGTVEEGKSLLERTIFRFNVYFWDIWIQHLVTGDCGVKLLASICFASELAVQAAGTLGAEANGTGAVGGRSEWSNLHGKWVNLL